MSEYKNGRKSPYVVNFHDENYIKGQKQIVSIGYRMFSVFYFVILYKTGLHNHLNMLQYGYIIGKNVINHIS